MLEGLLLALDVFAMLILMAIVTTCMAGPILDRVILPDWQTEAQTA